MRELNFPERGKWLRQHSHERQRKSLHKDSANISVLVLVTVQSSHGGKGCLVGMIFLHCLGGKTNISA